MTNVLVRDLPEEVHAKLVHRAHASGQSLQQYLTEELTKLAVSPTMDEVLERIESRSGGTVGSQQAVDDLDEERGRL